MEDSAECKRCEDVDIEGLRSSHLDAILGGELAPDAVRVLFAASAQQGSIKDKEAEVLCFSERIPSSLEL